MFSNQETALSGRLYAGRQLPQPRSIPQISMQSIVVDRIFFKLRKTSTKEKIRFKIH